MRYTSLILALAAIAATLTEAQLAPTTTTPAPSENGTTTSDPTTPNFPIQTFESTPCSQCTFASFPKEAACAALVPVDIQQLQAAFTPTSVNINAIITAVNGNPAIKNCVCHWATGTYNQTTGGAAATCLTSEPSVPGPAPAVTAGGGAPCNATQAAQAEAKFGMLAALIHCDAVVSHSTGRPNDPVPTPSPSSSGSAGVAGIGLVMSVGAIVLAMVIAL